VELPINRQDRDLSILPWDLTFQYGFLGRLSGTGQKYSITVIIIDMKKPKYSRKP
jgi:hypothetical protein